jgi:transposase
MDTLFWPDEALGAAIEPHLPKNQPGARRVDDRRVISGILHVLKSGGRWRDCPLAYGPRTTIYNRFTHWSRRQIWQQILAALTCDISELMPPGPPSPKWSATATSSFCSFGRAAALQAVHAMRKGSILTTETLIKRGRRDDESLGIFLYEMAVKLRKQEPLTPGEQRDLRNYRNWGRRSRPKR